MYTPPTPQDMAATLDRVARAHAAGWIPVVPHPKQLVFLASPQREALYGGAAGGGKSEALLMGAAEYVDVPGFAAILFRKTHTDLAQPGALLDRSHEWWAGKAHWDGTNKIWRFPSGAKVALAYLSKPSDHLRYQSAEFQYIGFDETTQFPEHQYRYVGLSRLRRRAGVEVLLRTRGATNPGGPGHQWVFDRFVNGDHQFVPATLADNPSLDRKAYVDALEGLHPLVKAQLLRGDWFAREPGDYFRREWFGPLLDHGPDPHLSVRIRWWDLAASERPEDADGPRARTAGVLMSKDAAGTYYVEHALAFWRTPGARDDIILQTAQADGYATAVGIEQEPGSGGIAQAETLARRLKAHGHRVIIEPATNAKEERADPVASELERGWSTGWEPDPETLLRRGVRAVAGAWTEEYLSEVEAFPDGFLKDQADATASAYNWLRSRTPGGQAPLPQDERKPLMDEQEPGVGVHALAEDEDDTRNSEFWERTPQDREQRSRLVGLAAVSRYHRSSRDRTRRW